MIDWPPELVHEIVKERCILFLGAGVSASAKDAAGNSPPAWAEFLETASALLSRGATLDAVKEMIEQRQFLIALQAIKEHSDPSAYQALLNKTFNAPGFQASELHKAIYGLDARIVITTNFDKIYETYCEDIPNSDYAYKTIMYRSQGLADESRSDTRLVIKAHGSINDIPELIFTRAEYHKAKRDYVGFYDVIKSLFLTNTILFLGCGLDDPDIMLMLEEVRIVGRHEKPHYALALRGAKNALRIGDWKSTYNIRVLEYEPDHEALTIEVKRLLDLVQSERAAVISSLA